MRDWWEIPADERELDAALIEETRRAYYNVFYATEDGRAVLADLTQLAYTLSGNSDCMMARIEFLLKIKARAGANIQTDMAAIQAEAEAIEPITQGEQDASNDQ